MVYLFIILAFGAGLFALPGGGRGDADRRVSLLAAFCAIAAALFMMRLGVFGVLLLLVGAGIFGIGWFRDRLTDEGFQDLREDDVRNTPPPGGRQAERAAMSHHEALQVLGLSGSPSQEDILAAHRRLIASTHPDAGGSDYLASQINSARDRLLSS